MKKWISTIVNYILVVIVWKISGNLEYSILAGIYLQLITLTLCSGRV